jgi:sugar phosphate isomerase/epimerase
VVQLKKKMMEIAEMQNTTNAITLAVSVQWHSFPEKFEWLAGHGFAMEYTPHSECLYLTPKHLLPYLRKNIPIRHHGYFPGFELGDIDDQKAELALHVHKRAVDVMQGYGEQVMTVHIGLQPHIELDHKKALENMCRLVEYSRKLGVTVCLENLRRGPTSNPETVVEWAVQSGASITMDIGHAVSCQRVQRGELKVPEIVEKFSFLLEEVHFYESETDIHHAPKDMSILGPVVDQLVKTDCRWWTIELNDYDEILNTRQLIQNYLTAKADSLSFFNLRKATALGHTLSRSNPMDSRICCHWRSISRK